MNMLLCICGMPGAGKSVTSDFFIKHGFQFVRFGQVVLDEIIKRNIAPNEVNQKEIRENFRKTYGMDAMAKLNLKKFEVILKDNNVVADGLYSWSEYKYLKSKFKDQMILLAIYASPKLRYERLSLRKPSKTDIKLRDHHFSKNEARMRDINEIENIEKGGPIAMADYTILNTKDLNFLNGQLESVLIDLKGPLK